jgi:uncharacterized protein (TIGR02453 family)
MSGSAWSSWRPAAEVVPLAAGGSMAGPRGRAAGSLAGAVTRVVHARTPAAGAAPFRGFPDSSGRFFEALLLHNDRDWFQAHRAEYDEGWAAPMASLLAEVRSALRGSYGRRELGEPKVFRIHRDVRFSRDKRPYKTHLGGWIPLQTGRAATPGEAPAAIYLQVGADGRFAGSGCWTLDAPALKRFRAAVLDPRRGGALARLLVRLEAQGFSRSAAEVLQRAPRGVDPAHPRADLLRMKGLVVAAADVPRRLLTRPELAGWLAEQARAAAPVVCWLADHVA